MTMAAVVFFLPASIAAWSRFSGGVRMRPQNTGLIAGSHSDNCQSIHWLARPRACGSAGGNSCLRRYPDGWDCQAATRARYPVAFTNLEVLAAVASPHRSLRRWIPLALFLLALVAGGVLYQTTFDAIGRGSVIARAAATGDELWEAELTRDVFKGPALADGATSTATPPAPGGRRLPVVAPALRGAVPTVAPGKIQQACETAIDRRLGTLVLEKGQGSFVPNSLPTWRTIDTRPQEDPAFEVSLDILKEMLLRFPQP